MEYDEIYSAILPTVHVALCQEVQEAQTVYRWVIWESKELC